MSSVTRFVLTQKVTFALLKLMEAEYVESKLSDPDFAVVATKKLGLERGLSAGHIGTARATLGLPSNVAWGKAATKTLLEGKVTELEELVLAQAVRLDDCIRKIEALQRDLHLHPPGVKGR